ncbi:Fur family transcriptional regulator [Nitratifractor salsuginis]|uniref:Ferric uptake regulator, Fur family n=1 Tax=Nitratifractor salsuginis (strain DSM 16511 / JCM 12458 / E9I37-1) TaxID=749222 RepID=E6X3K9_NITSE|nr:Fur family transcriptional regulator [Nitratifractor salsuginis]ADV46286.1 ferric uptake regulator, Fur family [Nitratifractor salsuginis DSM 16511]
MKNYAEILKEHGLKATFQRMTILAAIDRMGHANVDEIYEEVRQSHPTLSLATVYKNIVTMVEQGVLVEVPIVGKKSKYELKKKEHLHLICTECGSVRDQALDEILSEDTDKVAWDSSFELKERQLNLYGICSDCRNKQASA